MPLQDSIFGTDSTSVLKYINNETSRFRTFVANRVSKILKVSRPSQWRYVNTSSNPADLASRGLKVESFLKNRTCVSGPQFLIQPVEEWPVNPDGSREIPPEDPEVKRSVTVNTIQTRVEDVDAVTRIINYFSSWIHLKRIVCWILRLKKLLLCLSQKRKQKGLELAQSGMVEAQQKQALEKEIQSIKAQANGGYLSIEELRIAELEIIRFCQKGRFPAEISSLEKGEAVKRNSHIYKLNPVLKDGVLRVGGRLSRAAMPEDSKHPVILSKDLHISDIILRHIHHQVGHCGRNHVIYAATKILDSRCKCGHKESLVQMCCLSEVTCCSRASADGRLTSR